jgi:hypothetical protein
VVLQKNNVYKWALKYQKTFDELKERLVSAPILAYPNFIKPFIIYYDASDLGIGAILQQKDENKYFVRLPTPLKREVRQREV